MRLTLVFPLENKSSLLDNVFARDCTPFQMHVVGSVKMKGGIAEFNLIILFVF